MLHGNMESTSFWESHVRNSGMSGVGTAEFFGVTIANAGLMPLAEVL